MGRVKTYEDDKINKFLSDAILHMCKRGMSINLEHVRKLPDKCNGYFDYCGRRLVVATARSIDIWISDFIHEYCHFLQWEEGYRQDYDTPWIELDEWLTETKDHSIERIIIHCQYIKELERENEQRAVNLIRERGLDINLPSYIRSSNAYLWFHDVLPEIRYWPKKHPYERDSVCDRITTRLITPDRRCPKWYRQLLIKQVEKERGSE